MLANACFEIFHTDSGNKFRNQSYDNVLSEMAGIPRLISPTIYLNTAEKLDQFLTDTPKFKVNTVEDYCQPGETFPPSSGVIGVWASNYTAYKNFLETDRDTLILFEDDIVLSKNFKDILNSYLMELPEDWEFFSPFVPDDSLFAYNEMKHSFNDDYLTCRSYQQWSCATYVVNRAGAKRAIENIESMGITAPIDWYIFNFRMKQEDGQIRFNTYTIKPNSYRPVKLLLEAAAYSSIHKGITEELNRP
jgi:GR25 family glycosyltransferase involved in LPS biosynthesis